MNLTEDQKLKVIEKFGDEAENVLKQLESKRETFKVFDENGNIVDGLEKKLNKVPSEKRK